MKTFRLLDGAMGTELLARGMTMGSCPLLWNVNEPEKVAEVHRAYLNAGSEAILTNTFGGSIFALRRYTVEARMKELNTAAASVARMAAGPDAVVIGDIGPCTELMEPYGDLTEDDVSEAVFAQGTALLEGGVDCFLVETMGDSQEVCASIKGLLPLGLPVWASYTFDRTQEGPKTMMGHTPLEAITAAFAAGAYGAGANCGTSLTLADYLEIASALAQAFPDRPLILQPNAGAPVMTPDGPAYLAEPQDFTRFAKKAWGLGIKVLGGCCGTRPCHIQGMAAAYNRSD